MKKISLIYMMLCITFAAFAQNVTGVVSNETNEMLIGARVQWKHSKTGTTTDTIGRFSIPSRKKTDTLTVTYIGYNPTDVVVEPSEKRIWIEVRGVTTLADVVITADRPDNYISTLDSRYTEQITSCELRKAPCCNLAGSFETNGSVDINAQNAVTGTSEIQMLGLRGIYTQVTLQKRPNFYGLAYPFALEFFPGTWLDGISVSKGASSVEQGAQSLTGQINVNLVKPNEDNALFVNLYESTNGVFEANLHLNKKIDKNWSVGLLFHNDIMKKQIDHDKDGFANMPTRTQNNGMLRVLHSSDLWYGAMNVHLLKDNRVSGQLGESTLANPLWKVNQNMERLDVSGSFGYLGFDKIYNTLAVIYGATMHKTNELYGKNRHDGTQKSYYANLVYATILGNTDHRFRYGGSFQYDDYKENLNDLTLDRKDIMPGVFAEYDFNRTNINKSYSDLGIIMGLRADNHQKFGTIVSPRANIKYSITENLTWRASAGRGWRVANVVAENLSVLASNRAFVIDNNLKPEDGWNVGTNISGNFQLANRAASWSADIYHTNFINQIVTDVDKDYKNVYFYNLDGKSYSTSFMTMFKYNLFKNFDVKLSYKYNDVKVTYSGELNTPPLTAAHRGLITLDYKTNDKTWLFHVTTQLLGKQRLPDNSALPSQFQGHCGTTAPGYAHVNAQITKIIGKRWEVYFGGENLTNYTQHQPIIAYQAPFSEFFNASQVFGPIMGIRGFAGVRYFIPQNEEKTPIKSVFKNYTDLPTVQFEVNGACGMCKERIEKTAIAAGATSAVWDGKTHLLSVVLGKNTSEDLIQQAIATAGHDTPKYKTENSVYEKLPACCAYRE